jgi:hypothetical protein
MKGFDMFLKNEKYFDFSKMDKNKCPKMGCQKGPY